MKYYPELEIRETKIHDETLTKLPSWKISITTNVRKKYKGIWYVIEVFDSQKISEPTEAHINEIRLALINKVLKEALTVKHWYTLTKNPKNRGVIKDYFQLSEKARSIIYNQIRFLNR